MRGAPPKGLGACAELNHEGWPQLLAFREAGATFRFKARRKLGGTSGGRCRAEPSQDIAPKRTRIGTTKPARAGRGASDAARCFGKPQVGDEGRGSPPAGQHGFENWRPPKRKGRRKESLSW